MIDGRNKGAAGEREFCKWLQTKFNLEKLPTRNLEQTREGGADILGFKPFIFEVKRVETLALRHWWRQAKLAAKDNEIPVVAFRQNFGKWHFLIAASYLNPRIETGFLQLEEREFLLWVGLHQERNEYKRSGVLFHEGNRPIGSHLVGDVQRCNECSGSVGVNGSCICE